MLMTPYGGGWPAFNGGFGNFGGGGWPQMGWGAQYAPSGQQQSAGQMPAPETASYQPQIDKLKGRIGSLQNRATAADPAQQAQLQQRIGTLQGRVKDMRQQRRQAAQPQGQQTTQAPQGGGQQSGIAQYFGQLPPGFGQGPQGGYGVGGGMGGGMPWGGMQGGGWQNPFGAQYGNQRFDNSQNRYFDEWGIGRTRLTPQQEQEMMNSPAAMARRAQQGGYNPNANQTGAAPSQKMPGGTPVAPYRPQGAMPPGQQYTDQFGNVTTKEAYDQRLADFGKNGMNSLVSPDMFNTQFGMLTRASGGNSNVFKKNGGGEDMLYQYDPTAGWKTMSPDAYRGYGDYNYFDPTSSMDTARKAGAMSGSNMW